MKATTSLCRSLSRLLSIVGMLFVSTTLAGAPICAPDPCVKIKDQANGLPVAVNVKSCAAAATAAETGRCQLQSCQVPGNTCYLLEEKTYKGFQIVPGRSNMLVISDSENEDILRLSEVELHATTTGSDTLYLTYSFDNFKQGPTANAQRIFKPHLDVHFHRGQFPDRASGGNVQLKQKWTFPVGSTRQLVAGTILLSDEFEISADAKDDKTSDPPVECPTCPNQAHGLQGILRAFFADKAKDTLILKDASVVSTHKLSVCQ